MDKEFLYMQKLAGLITENEYQINLDKIKMEEFAKRISKGVEDIKKMLEDEGYDI
jgi:ribosomal protein L31E